MSPIAQKRRRDAFMVLAGGVVLTALLAFVTASVFAIGVFVVTALMFAAYVVALVQIRRRAQERSAKIHYLPQPVHGRPLVLHRSVSSSSL
jgi:Ca2+/Na+ antiporter